MGGKYSFVGNATNTASATLPMWNLSGATTSRLSVGYIQNGSDATPAENAGKFAIQRSTATGTGGSTPAAFPLNPADGASIATINTAYVATGPTLTASAFLHQWAQNMRATYQWWANPGFELVVPATAAAGVACMPTVTTTAANYAFTVAWTE